MIHDETVTILENSKINGKYYKLVFRSPRLSRAVRPGQFLQVRLNQGLDPFLRRPFSYYRVAGNRIEILYEVLGYGTELLARLRKGDRLEALGPLGRPFSAAVAGKRRVLVAGGVGVPPLIFLAERVRADYFLIGAKSGDEVLPRSELAKVRGKVLYSTNDGSYGKRGYVTVLLAELIRRESPRDLFIQTCGPTPMMKAVLEIARREGIEGEASVDETMACGMGVCLGCMVKTPGGWVPSCTQGPIFKLNEILEL